MVVPHHICVAAAHGNVEQLRAYFSAGDRDPNDIDEHHGQTLLDYACRGGRSDGECRISCPMLSFLLSQGASLNYQDPGGTWHRPLVIAAVTCSKNQTAHRMDLPPITDPLKLLIEAGADVNADPGLGGGPGFTALMQAVVRGNTEVVKFLLSHGATLDSGIEARKAQAAVTAERFGTASARAEVDMQTVEDYCEVIIHPLSQTPMDVVAETRAMLKFFRDYRAAGETVKGFLWAPRADLCMLRLLCEQGRASPRLGQVGARMADARVVDREERDFLVRLFAWAPAGRTDSRRRTRSAQVAVTAAPLPRDVFKLVVSFWRPNREWWWSDYRYSRVNRYDAPWMG